MSRAAKLDLRVFQQELATRLASKTAAQVESSRLGLACAGDNWLIRLSDASEVIAVPPIAAVPLTKPWFMGVANIRGNLYTVIDFARFLGQEPQASTQAAVAQARLVVFGPRAGDLRAAIVVQRVLGLRNITELAPVPVHQTRPWYGQRWIDASGAHWQEIDLARLAQDPAFLQAGL